MASRLVALTLASAALVQAYPIPYLDKQGVRMEVQSHRGGRGLRTEETAWAFAYAMAGPSQVSVTWKDSNSAKEVGSDVLEMDTVFTSDGVPVIWHDHSISAEKCSGPYVSRYIANLTLAQVKEMDCDIQLPGYPQQEIHRGSTIQTLEEILDLINCYGDSGFRINLETKLDPTAPNQTLSVETYINDLIPILQRRGFASRTTIQSFDWRTLIGIKRKWPETVTVALLDDTTVVRDPTASIPYPWLGGVNLDSFGGDWVAAAHSIDAGIVSPVHGVPSNATVNTIGYKAFVTRANTQRAHQLGMQMVPWTVNDESTMSKLVDDGVDAIISDYPERVLSVARQRGISVGRARARSRPACLARADS